ncbi:MAG: PD-(D/E)XK nuclease domain-containing protein [Prevotella sp.]|nr:PD-(D/E)XK nuclease domain-containing protein [Prevotella sp.]
MQINRVQAQPSDSEAIAQIEKKGYTREYGQDSRPVYRIGRTFGTKTETVGDRACEC